MVLIWTTLSQDIPYTFAKFNLFFAVLDAILFWLWGYSAANAIAWFLFIFALIRIVIAFILFRGVPEQNYRFEQQIIAFVGYIIWTIFIIVLRVYGVWIIGGFIRKVESDLGRTSTFPWSYFTEPIRTQNSAESPATSHI